jgi:hypothetical protein
MKILLLLLSASASAQNFEMAMAPRWFPPMLPQVVQPPVQPPALNFSYGLQPLETLRTVAGRKVRGLALAEVTVCNDSAGIIRLSPIRLTQYLHSKGELLPGPCVARAPLVRWPVKGRK